ncbi:translation initiation factor IF-2-like [Gallus gallus]|uniref:translation initiation factor IF-2-like n=1 Tax=Gallus gallus TaxID=9031 RepID=UPI001F028DC4|nr:translation initiation factor IF-2-like [Gallus gallus]
MHIFFSARRADPWSPSRRSGNEERYSPRNPVRFVAPPQRLVPRCALCGAAVGRKRRRVGGGPFRRARWLSALCPATASSSASSSPTAARCRSAPPSWYFGVSILVSQVPGPKTGSKRAGACGLPKAGSGRAAGRWRRRRAGRAEPKAPGGERRPCPTPSFSRGRDGMDRAAPGRTGLSWRRCPLRGRENGGGRGPGPNGGAGGRGQRR